MAKKLTPGDQVKTPAGGGVVQKHFYGSASGLPYVEVLLDGGSNQSYRTSEVTWTSR